MNGQTSVILDTNAAIAHMLGDATVARFIAGASAVFISVVTLLEFRAGDLSTDERARFQALIEQTTVVSLDAADTRLLDQIVLMRRSHRLKLPDAIIAATAIERRATLVTRDQHFSNVAGLDVVSF